MGVAKGGVVSTAVNANHYQSVLDNGIPDVTVETGVMVAGRQNQTPSQGTSIRFFRVSWQRDNLILNEEPKLHQEWV